MKCQLDGIEQIAKTELYIAQALRRERPMKDGVPLPLSSGKITVTGTLFSESLTAEVSYDYPSDYDARQLDQELKPEVEKTILDWLDQMDRQKHDPLFFPEKLSNHNISDSLEYILVPRMGDTAHQLNVPFFKYRIKVTRGAAARAIKGFNG